MNLSNIIDFIEIHLLLLPKNIWKLWICIGVRVKLCIIAKSKDSWKWAKNHLRAVRIKYQVRSQKKLEVNLNYLMHYVLIKWHFFMIQMLLYVTFLQLWQINKNIRRRRERQVRLINLFRDHCPKQIIKIGYMFGPIHHIWLVLHLLRNRIREKVYKNLFRINVGNLYRNLRKKN